MSWVWLIAPLIALFGPLAIPFFGVMESITSGALTNMEGSTLLDVTYVSKFLHLREPKKACTIQVAN